ncbi:glutaminyl-peptide cyclotransferase [Kutzneria kofuensis]|uniref:Glutaminyl-peptide cyclotransferase n=1 Tax=Kutzneria kofuensis TaxID=103725 RepID=A0A7W9KGD4_9PSEU|nr:glutaminyl-peptide cyclotransferase [Kutzneria kofuensis]MBB5892096.1 glutaminyl-peptide cyclotransferase [Kutzneria kofuensis]
MRAALLSLAVVLVTACAAPGGPPHLRVEVLGTIPHDTSAFTEGYELADGVLYESTGLTGSSTLRAVDPRTGRVVKSVALPPDYFGEGIAVVGDKIWQLTWQQNVAMLRDRATLQQVSTASYQDEGWGLCYDGKRLVMSDGTSLLTFRDPSTFAVTGHVQVDYQGRLNELECVDGSVWANVYPTKTIIRVDPASGAVQGVADLSKLGPTGDTAPDDVLNGISVAPDPGQFLVTGKRWPLAYRVRFVRDGS